MRQPDVQPYRTPPRFRRAAISRLHDARAASRADHIAVTIRAKALRPGRDQFRQLARIFVITSERSVRSNPRRSEKYDRLVDLHAAKSPEGLEVLGKNPNWTRFIAIEKLLVLVRKRRTGRRIGFARLHDFRIPAKSTKQRSTSVPTSSTVTWSPTSKPL